MIFHDTYTGTNVHTPITWTYTNAIGRTGASGFVSTDIGKFAWQADTNAIYILTATTPTWVLVGFSTIASLVLASGSLWVGNGSNVPTAVALSGDLTMTNAGVITVKKTWVIPISGALATTTTFVDFVIPNAMTLAKVVVSVGTAPATNPLVVDILYHATAPGSKTTIYTTGPGTNRPSIATSATLSTGGVPDVTNLAQWGHLGITMSSSAFTAASDMTVMLIPA